MRYEKYSYMPLKEYYKTWFIGLPLRLENFYISIKDRNKIHLMDDVIYNGKKCFVNNGIRSNEKGERLWDILETEWNPDGTRNHYLATDAELTKVKNLETFKNSCLSHYRWYMIYWYQIQVRELMEKRKK
jgi:hypothetical protein